MISPVRKLPSHCSPGPRGFCHFTFFQQCQGPEWGRWVVVCKAPDFPSASNLGLEWPHVAFFLFPFWAPLSAAPWRLAGEGWVSKHATWSGSQLRSRWLLV